MKASRIPTVLKQRRIEEITELVGRKFGNNDCSKKNDKSRNNIWNRVNIKIKSNGNNWRRVCTEEEIIKESRGREKKERRIRSIWRPH